jgi:hypothetical protein
VKDELLRNWMLPVGVWTAIFALVGCKRAEPAAMRQLSRSAKAAASVVRPAAPTPGTPQVVPSAAQVDLATPGRTAKCWDAEVAVRVGSAKATRLIKGAAIDKEVENALDGKPRRITIDAHTGVTMYCDCPFFVLNADEVGYDFIHPEYQGDVGRGVAWSVLGTYRLTGYYSGRLINTYQHINEHLEPGEDPVAEGSGDDEQRSYWPERHPEFCIESWCFIPGAHWKEDPRTENQPKELAEMRRLGGRFCR